MLEPVTRRVTASNGIAPARGHIVGLLHRDEDQDALERMLLTAPQRVATGDVELLTHLDLVPNATPAARRKEVEIFRQGVLASRLQRYVFALDTGAGRRIVKIFEPLTVGNRLLGLVGRSVSRREHANQTRACDRDIAVCESRGFLEWRTTSGLVRSCHVQTPMGNYPSVGLYLAAALDEHGDAAAERLGEALARAHAVPFFHADLKGFHAFVDDIQQHEDAPASYRLRFLDLARVSFHMTPRKRVINLYQALRWILPTRPEVEERFVTAYCRAAGWQAHAPGRALSAVRRFLAHKYRTHNP